MKRCITAIGGCIAVALALTACTFLTPQGLDTWSSSGAGVNVEGVGPLAVRNVLVVANEDGTEGNLIAAIVNDTTEDHLLHIEVGEDSPAELEILVPAESTVSFGEQDSLEEPPLIEPLDADPGSTVKMYFQAGDDIGTLTSVPVLDGCLSYLEGLEPDGVFSPEECPAWLR